MKNFFKYTLDSYFAYICNLGYPIQGPLPIEFKRDK